MADHVVQCGGCRVDVRVVGEVVRCPACSRTAPVDEAIQAARSHLIDIVMRDLGETLREVVRASPTLGYRPAEQYDWVLAGVSSNAFKGGA